MIIFKLYEDVNAIPLDASGDGSVKRRDLNRTRMHVPNWDKQQKFSATPTLVSDGKCFWHEVKHRIRVIDEDDPLSMLNGVWDQCETRVALDCDAFHNNKTCQNCSANYTLRSFGYGEESDISLRTYLATIPNGSL